MRFFNENYSIVASNCTFLKASQSSPSVICRKTRFIGSFNEIVLYLQSKLCIPLKYKNFCFLNFIKLFILCESVYCVLLLNWKILGGCFRNADSLQFSLKFIRLFEYQFLTFFKLFNILACLKKKNLIIILLRVIKYAI